MNHFDLMFVCGARYRMSALTISVQHCTGGYSHFDKARRRNKEHYIGKEELKFADNMIIYVEKSDGILKKLLELVSEFSKVAEYKVIILYKDQLHFYIQAMNNWKLELKNTIYNSIKNKKYLGINLTKDVQEL